MHLYAEEGTLKGTKITAALKLRMLLAVIFAVVSARKGTHCKVRSHAIPNVHAILQIQWIGR